MKNLVKQPAEVPGFNCGRPAFCSSLSALFSDPGAGNLPCHMSILPIRYSVLSAQEQNYEMDNGNSSQSTMIDQKTHVKKFLHIFLPVTLLLIVLSIVLYQRELTAHRERVTTREMRTLENRRETVTNLLKSVVADLRILTSLQEMQALPEGASEEDAAALAAELLTFSAYRGIYEQVSFIDRQGMEIIRVDYHNDDAAVVPRLELQFQKKQPLFPGSLPAPGRRIPHVPL